MAARAQFSPKADDPLRSATPEVDDVEARRARAAIENRLFSGPPKRVNVGRYRVEGRLGAGGMGVVYRAHDPELARDVALKLMNTAAVSDEEASVARGRLVREARAMAKLAHPNVIHVYDVGAVDDGVFIAMELVEGDPLSKWIARESPGWRETLRFYLDAGEGLAAAHVAGIVHRDFKPENVMLGADGRVRVGDFGLAGGPGSETGRHEHLGGDIDNATVDNGIVSSSLTRTGALLGTPKYMAPEQEAGLSATARSDQFGFCVALYEGLYGHPPYEGTTVAAYRQAVNEEAVQVPDNREVPKWVFELLHRGLRRDPADRHPNMRTLIDALRSGLTALTETRPRKRRALWILTLGVGVGMVAALGVGLALADDPPAPEAVQALTATLPGSAELLKDVALEVVALAQRESPDPAPPSEPVPEPSQVEPSRVEVSPPQITAPAPETSKVARMRGEACFYQEDKRSFIAARRKRAATIQSEGTCYTCRKAGAYVVTTLSPPPDHTCRTSHLCNATPSDACKP